MNIFCFKHRKAPANSLTGFTPLENKEKIPSEENMRRRFHWFDFHKGRDVNFLTGFTLIELLVVIAIIGLLGSIVYASLGAARARGRDARRLSDIREIQKALEFHYIENGFYPKGSWQYSYSTDWQTGYLATALDKFMPTLPTDPRNESTPPPHQAGYSYGYYSGNWPNGGPYAGRWYMLVFTFEDKKHSMQQSDGVQRCEGSLFQYGTGSNGVITIGGDCS